MHSFLQRPVLKGKVNFPLCLAPMVGLSHIALRNLCQLYLPPEAVTIWPTEMLNSRKLPIEKVGFTPETLRSSNEQGLAPQILANEEEPIRLSVKKLEIWGAEAIDINMGCPVAKALKHNYGVALMGDSSYAAKVVEMTVRSTSLPVSVKLRAGHQNNFEFLKDFAQGLEQAGASWLTLHPRTSEQKRRGSADWSQVLQLRNHLSVPLIGNGDVQTHDRMWQLLQETHCDMVMVGRALTARPWLFWQIGETLGMRSPNQLEAELRPEVFGAPPKQAPRSPEAEALEYGYCCWWMLQSCFKNFGPSLGLRKFRYYIKTSSVWLNFGQSLLGLMNQGETLEHLEPKLLKFFSVPLELFSETQLRE